MAAPEVKLSHGQLEKFVNETLSKREPCPAMVLAWGWLLKQGEGGFFHGDGFKQRYFVLARVPHATVLIYYGEKTMDEDHILGYIDLRRVTAVQEGTKMVVVDGGRPAPGAAPASASGGGFMARMFGRSTSSAASGGSDAPRATVELLTTGRVYVLVPCSILMPPPMTTSAALSASDGTKPLYLFGWPFPVPPLDAADDTDEVANAIAAGMYNAEAFAQWRDVMATAVAAERATRVYPVMVLVDSTAQLPQRVLLRTTPCEIAIISVDDKDLCFAAVPYNDLIKWDVQAETEVHITARTRSRLVAKSDRSGFSAQRPTRPTCHFVFKSQASARQIIHVIDNHLRELAKQLGEGTGADAVADEPAAAADDAGEEDTGEGGGKLVGRKPADDDGPRRAAAGGDDDDDDEPAPSRKSSGSSGKAPAKKPAKKADSDDDESDEAPKPKPAARKSVTKKKVESDDDDSDEAPKPKKKAAKKPVDSDDDEDERPKKSSSKKSSSASKRRADSDDEEEEEKPKKKKPSKKKADSDDDDDSDDGGKKKKSSPKGKKSKKDEDDDDDDSDEDARKKAKRKASKSKRKADSDDDDDE